MSRRVIVLEDDESLRLVITKALSRAGFEVRATASPDTAIERMARREADALVADVLLGKENFLERLNEVRSLRPDAPVIVMSAQTTAATALKADTEGAFEYLPKPFDINDLTALLDRALEKRSPQRKSATASENLGLVGQSIAMQDTFRSIARLARTQAPVLITGPDGSGRATAAKAIHHQANPDAPWIEAGPRQLDRDASSLWTSAVGGTLLLRRAEDWSIDAQQFVREHLERNDATAPRLIVTGSPTVTENLPLALINLMAVGFMAIPPVYQRGADRALLFEHFITMAGSHLTVTEEAKSYVNAQAWPGEVLQLKRVADHILAQGQSGAVSADHVAKAIAGPMGQDPDRDLENAGIRYFAASDAADCDDLASRAITRLETGLIRAALESAGGVRQEAAKRLGMNRNTFARKLDQLNLDTED